MISPGRRGLLLAAWTGATLAIALAAIGTILDAPARDLVVLGAVFGAAGAAGVAGTLLLAGRAGRMPLAWTVGAWLATVLAIAIANTVAAALLMFFSAHDLQLLLIVLAYSTAVTAGPAAVLAARMGERARAVEAAANEVGAGSLAVRAPVSGRDELARVATAFNEMTARLQAAEDERRRLDVARRDLFAAVSHDLRTPLATMRAMVEAMRDGIVADAATRQRYLENINGELRYLSQLVDDLFELARLDSGELRLHLDDVRLDLLIEEALDSFRPAAERAGVALIYEQGHESAVVRADGARVTRALYNLVQNAVRHTPPDGTVTVQLARLGGDVAVVVSDTGEGIEPAELPRVFDRFYRGERSRSREQGGAGLGLAIVRSIAEAHGGSVAAESHPSRGSTFRMTLPATGG